jgi:hypothetical protein
MSVTVPVLAHKSHQGPDEQQAPDASAAPAVAKKKGKKITLRELPHEGAGLAANRPPPRADLDS